MPGTSTTFTKQLRPGVIITVKDNPASTPCEPPTKQEMEELLKKWEKAKRRTEPPSSTMKEEVIRILEDHCSFFTASTETRFLCFKWNHDSTRYSLKKITMHDPRIAGKSVSEMRERWAAKAGGKPQQDFPEVIEVNRFTFDFLYALQGDVYEDNEFTEPTWTPVSLSEVKDAVDHWCAYYNAVERGLGCLPLRPKLGFGYIRARREMWLSSKEKKELAKKRDREIRDAIQLSRHRSI
ncbi:hypothetical protein NMY22_g17585 [Coprinellus aureogranulatus]|nr:hypothetical protein NMY22_g17585 [Coprinellus aureogranulatus]